MIIAKCVRNNLVDLHVVSLGRFTSVSKFYSGTADAYLFTHRGKCYLLNSQYVLKLLNFKTGYFVYTLKYHCKSRDIHRIILYTRILFLTSPLILTSMYRL